MFLHRISDRRDLTGQGSASASNIFCVKFLLYLGIMGKLYPVGIQNFESLRRDGFFYVDKTALMYRLVTTGRYYFLSRPILPGEE